jgi:hypothetical protein
MKLEELSSGLVIVAVAVAALLAIAACVFVMTRTSAERRAGFGRLLGKAFIILIAGTMLLAAVQQWGR